MERENVPPSTEPPKKKKRLLLTLKSRFKSVADDKLEKMKKLFVPKNTEQSSKWALTNLQEWYEDYNGRNSDSKCPGEVVTAFCSPDVLAKWMCVFMTETRSKSEKEYVPSPLQVYFLA